MDGSKRRLSPWIGGLACAGLVLVSCAGERERPHVLLLSVDSLRLDHASFLGRAGPTGEPTTPALDALAARGVWFDQAFSSTSWTLPSHAALMTGLPDDLHGVHGNFQRLGSEVTTLAELLGRAGYRTAGYFSGPNVHPAYGFGRGFERYEDHSLVDVDEARLAEHGTGALRDVHLASHRAITSPSLTAAAIGFLDEWASATERDPFFLFVHWWDPHYDYLAPEDYVQRFVSGSYRGPFTGSHVRERTMRASSDDVRHLRELYDAEIRYTDDHIGKLLGSLSALGELDRTVVVYTADHGEEFYEHGRWGHQRTLFDDVVRIPLAIAGPEVPQGVRVAGQARIFDIYATVAELCDVGVPHQIEGQSLSALWRDPGHQGWPALLRLCVDRVGQPVDLVAVRFGTHMVERDLIARRAVVYDLVNDPRQQRPIPEARAEGPAAVALERFEAYLQRMEALSEQMPSSQPLDLPEDLRRQLGAAGYLTGEDG